MYDDAIGIEANQDAAAKRLQAFLLDFMRREGISDLGLTFSACLVDPRGNPVDEVTLAVKEMMWQSEGENWAPPADILPFERREPK